MSPRPREKCWSRPLLVAAVTSALSIAGHASAGGALPGASTLILLALITGLPARFAVANKLTPARTFLYMAATQVFWHTALSVTAKHTVAPLGHHGAHAHHGHLAVATTPEAHTGHLLMLIAHVTAAVAIGAFLSYGDHLIASLARIISPASPPAPALPACRPQLPAAAAPPSPVPHLVRTTIIERGPPTRGVINAL